MAIGFCGREKCRDDRTRLDPTVTDSVSAPQPHVTGPSVLLLHTLRKKSLAARLTINPP